MQAGTSCVLLFVHTAVSIHSRRTEITSPVFGGVDMKMRLNDSHGHGDSFVSTELPTLCPVLTLPGHSPAANLPHKWVRTSQQNKNKTNNKATWNALAAKVMRVFTAVAVSCKAAGSTAASKRCEQCPRAYLSCQHCCHPAPPAWWFCWARSLIPDTLVWEARES